MMYIYINFIQLIQLNLDSLSYVNNFISENPVSSSRSPLYKNFFHKIIYTWNSLPFSIRNIADSTNFKYRVTNHFWNLLLTNTNSGISIQSE